MPSPLRAFVSHSSSQRLYRRPIRQSHKIFRKNSPGLAGMKVSNRPASLHEQIVKQGPASTSRHSRHTSRACAICRRRKTKCDGVEPACGTCVVQGQQCEYSSEPDRRKSKDGQAALDNLRRRVAELESQLRSIGTQKNDWPLLSCTLRAAEPDTRLGDALVFSCVPHGDRMAQVSINVRCRFRGLTSTAR